jgi:hypothetical protein
MLHRNMSHWSGNDTDVFINLLGSHTNGTKYAKLWIVFTTIRVQNIGLFAHERSLLRAAGPRTRDSGRRPFINGSTGPSAHTIAIESTRVVVAIPQALMRTGRTRGRMRPPMAVPVRFTECNTEVALNPDKPAKMTPLAKPRLSTNHSDT